MSNNLNNTGLPASELAGSLTTKKKFTKTNSFWLILALCLVFIGAFFANMVNTNVYRTDVFDFSIPTEDGQQVTGTVFKPNTATASNPAPCVVFVPGFQRTKESHYDLALEFARRGMVCYIIDPYNQGDSTSTYNTSASSAEGGAYGSIPLINYLYDTGNVNYIDRDKISLCGHSAGGNSAMTAAVYFSNLAGGVYEECKIKSVYVSGYIRNIISVDYEVDEDGGQLFAKVDENGNYLTEPALDENGNEIKDEDGNTVTKKIYTTKEDGLVAIADDEAVDWEGSKVVSLAVNVGFGYSDIDEGAWQNINLTGDITRKDSYEALALITSGNVHLELRETGLESGKVYGQACEGTMKVGYQEHCYHGVQPFDVTATSHIMYFFDMVYELESGVSPNDQIWMWKQLAQLVLMVGLFMAIFPLTGMLLEIPFFKSIKFERPAKKMPVKAKPWIIFGITLALGATCACFSFVPLADLSKIMFQDAAAHMVTWFFPERMNNAVMLWAVVNGAFGFLLFFVSWLLNGKERMKENFLIGVKNFFKTMLCAFLVWLGFYGLVHITDYIFNVDARFTFVAVRTTNIRYLIYELMYLPFFYVFYLSNSVRVNLSAQTNNDGTGWKKVLQYVLAVAANTIGLFGIFAIQYISIAVNGLMYWTTDWLFTNMLWILIPMMFALPIFQKIIYKKSNNIYLSSMITCLIFITMSMCNSVAHGVFCF